MTPSRRSLPALLLASRRAGSVVSTPATALSVAAAAGGAGLLLAASVGAFDGWRGSGGLALVGVAFVGLGAVGLRRYRVARHEAPATAFAALVAVLFVQVVMSALAYLAAGTFDRVDDALFESAAGFSTTALSVVEDPGRLPDSVAFWRALTQWSGGLTALVATATIAPVLGVNRGAVGDLDHRPSHLPLASRQGLQLLRKLFGLYVVLTAIGAALLLTAGMGRFDSVLYALTTVSSGGFAHHADSIAAFDSTAIEVAVMGGMLLAALNLAVVFRSARGLASGSFLRSAELRAFLVLLVGLSIGVVLTADTGQGFTELLTDATFSVVSTLSTTGFWVADWGTWSNGAQALIMVAIGIGSMSGSIGGGFRVARAMALTTYARREVVRQLRPSVVVAVKVGRQVVDDRLMDRIVGYQILYLFIGGLGALGLALGGASVMTALTGTVSALSTVGPALGQLAPGGGVESLDPGGRLALIPLMILGRLELAPVLVGLAALARAGRRAREDTRS